MMQKAEARSPMLLEREQNISARRKSAHETSWMGRRMRVTVEEKKSRNGWKHDRLEM
jgi:hypothetical protein